MYTAFDGYLKGYSDLMLHSHQVGGRVSDELSKMVKNSRKNGQIVKQQRRSRLFEVM